MNIEDKLAKPDKTIGQHSNELIEQAKLLYKLGYIKSESYIQIYLLRAKNTITERQTLNFKSECKGAANFSRSLKFRTMCFQYFTLINPSAISLIVYILQ